ncbi:MAG: TonB-dependent receptor, partial [Proteobacteria bacterium]
ASAASEDHAVAFDPLTVERTEIVRGPLSLLYGNSAVGGVVNIVTNRIPEILPESPTGRVSAEYGTVDQNRNLGLSGEAKVSDHWAVHVDGLVRKSEDYKVPGFQRTAEARETPLEPGETEGNGTVVNSASKAWSGALGASYIKDESFAGASLSNFSTTYGTVAEQGVTIDMDQRRLDLAAGTKNLGWLESLRLRGSFSNYKHQEIANGEVGTTFRNRGGEARVEARHQKEGVFSGLGGVQANVFQFEAIGEEAFLPTTHNSSYALFAFEEADLGRWKPSLGARMDLSRVASAASATFGAGEDRNFANGNISIGVLYELNPEFSLALNTGLTSRAPNYQELFADGQHVATRQFERGDRNLSSERGRSAEISLRHKNEDAKG